MGRPPSQPGLHREHGPVPLFHLRHDDQCQSRPSDHEIYNSS
jgi:hypothetical protein